MTEEIWAPGSFTKNFAWGKDDRGLVELHTAIRRGFGESIEDVPRERFRERVPELGDRVLVALNFFLFNRSIDGEDMILADELVFQALSWDHSKAFDMVAIFAFLFSRAGKWKGARAEQRRPALWASAYILERLSKEHAWNADNITKADIESFVRNDPRYRAQTTALLHKSCEGFIS
ncbi:hypothetical protein [Gemmobacter sp.]|uniref:hypothetical protein n=1 Tax=Gemmobacter sp. TaxID=1898957 RepID=UPI002AFFD200|nr:hypothetical protein [Gemmobacter sp.]